MEINRENPPTITLGGRTHAMRASSFCEREDLTIAAAAHVYRTTPGGASYRTGMPAARVCAAAIGLCTRVGAELGLTLAGAGYDVMAYGGAVYSALREQGTGLDEIVSGGRALLESVITQTFPRAAEVKAQADFTASGERPTVTPSASH